MKKSRFISIAVAVVLFVSAWVFAQQFTLNGIIPVGATSAYTSVSCRTFTGSTTIIITNGNVSINTPCLPATAYIELLYQNQLISRTPVPINTNFNNVVIYLPSNAFPANGTYCIRAYVDLVTPAPPPPPICGIKFTGK